MLGARAPVLLWRRRDDTFRIDDVNEAACELLGLARERVIGLTAAEFGGDSARATRDMVKAARSDEPVTREFPRVLPSGDVRDLELLYIGTGPDTVLSFMLDVTSQKHDEQYLRITEQSYRTLLASANDGVWVVEPSGVTTFANPKVGRILGRPLSEIADSNLLDFVDPLDRASVAGALACPRDTPAGFEARFRGGDGEEILCRLSVSPVPGSGSEPATLCLLGDLTVVQHERQLRERTEQRFRNMVETATEGVWTGDRDGKTTFVNATTAQMLGVDRDEIIGRPFTDFIIYDEAAAELRGKVERGEAPARGEFKLQRQDRRSVDVIASLSLLRDDAGEVIGSLAMITDVSELKREQAEVRESRARFTQIFEEAPVGMAFIGAGHLVRGHFLGANRAFIALLGYQEDALLDVDMLSITHPEDAAIERPLAAALFEGDRVDYSLEKRFIRVDGSTIWVRFRVHVLRDERGAPIYGLCVAADITTTKVASLTVADAAARAVALLDVTPDAVVEVDGEGRVRDLNGAALLTFGVAGLESIAKPFADQFVPDRLHVRFSEALADWLWAAASGRPIEPAETTMMRADGSEFPAELRVAAIANDGTTRLMLYVRNLALHDRAESARLESEERFERLFRDSPVGAVAIDMEGRLVDVNPAFCKLAGREAHALIGRNAAEVIADGDDVHEPPWRAGTDRPGPLSAVRRVARPDGRGMPVQVTASLVRNSTGVPSHWICQCTPKFLAPVDSLPEGDSLSYRERQVLSLLAHGHDGPEIAERLGLAPETVRSYAQSAREKIGAKTRTEAVALALIRGEISL